MILDIVLLLIILIIIGSSFVSFRDIADAILSIQDKFKDLLDKINPVFLTTTLLSVGILVISFLLAFKPWA